MNFVTFLNSRKELILDKWFDAILSDYPSETALFLKKSSDPFSNPVGHTFRKGIEELWEELIKSQVSEENIKAILEQMIKIRAVQDFPPSKAVSFLVYLKQPVRELLNKEANSSTTSWQELTEFEDRIDRAMLVAFELYAGCREKLYSIRIEELKNSIPKIYRDAVVRQCVGYQKEISSLVIGSEGEKCHQFPSQMSCEK